MDDLENLVKDFLAESQENLDRLDQDFLALEKTPSDRERLSSIFRTIHTLKSSSGYFGFSKLGALAHAGESLLSRLRDGTLPLTPEITAALLEMVDGVRRMLASVETSRQEGESDSTHVIERLQGLVGVTLGEGPPPETRPMTPDPVSPVAKAPAETPRGGVADTTLRVNLATLDHLMNLVGELVLTRNQVLKRETAERGASLNPTLQQLDHVTGEIHEAVMKTRMQPIGTIWQKLPRLVHDLALTCEKKVRLEMQGADTDLDKTLLEAMKDPLTHLVRNAVDHGLESPAERLSRGKPEEGMLQLRAFHEAGSVIIETRDDGKGLDLARIKQRAVERGLLSLQQLPSITERDVMALIFRPGFSTAETVTAISGRGVGMDVVKTNIEKIGGSIELESQPGQGTTLRIRLPLTLAIVSALMVTCRESRYAIPQANLLEVLHLDPALIENLYGALVYRLRGQLLPLVFLDRLLGYEGQTDSQVVVLNVGRRMCGLVVKEIQDAEEIVVKPLPAGFQRSALFAGATVMGDGQVALIIDVAGLARQIDLRSEEEEHLPNRKAPSEAGPLERQAILLLETLQGQIAIPLSKVSRLEKVSLASIETSGGRDVIQQGGQIMPVVYLSEKKDPLQLVVCAQGKQPLCLAVKRILDIVEEPLVIQRKIDAPGWMGAALLRGQVTDLVDVDTLAEKAA